MISIGIDISKDKSTVCIVKPYRKLVSKAYEINYTESDLLELSKKILALDERYKSSNGSNKFISLTSIKLSKRKRNICVRN